MSKSYFPHLHLPVPIQFHIQASPCIRLEPIFFSFQKNFITFLSNLRPCFLHFILLNNFFFLFQGASSLLDMILYYESTTHLDISDNSSMGTSCWRALAHLIKQVGWHSGIVIFSCRLSPGDNVHPRKWVCCTLHGLKMQGRANRVRSFPTANTSINTPKHTRHYRGITDSISRHDWLAVRWEIIGPNVSTDWLSFLCDQSRTEWGRSV